MTLPPGRARLATKPAPTGSAALAITMGMVVVAFFAANAVGAPVTTIRSTLRRTKSAASSGRRSGFCSANRYSMVIFFPSIHPSLLSSCRNASKRTALPEAVLASRKPMRKIFPVCCASPCPAHHEHDDDCKKPHPFSILDFRFSIVGSKNRKLASKKFHSCVFSRNPKSKIENPKCYLMTLSARASTFGGIVRPICLAAFRLMTNSNFVGCSTGSQRAWRLSGSCPRR